MKNLSPLHIVRIHTTITDSSQSTIRKTYVRWFVGSTYTGKDNRQRVYSRVSPYFKGFSDAENYIEEHNIDAWVYLDNLTSLSNSNIYS
jgi:hypothetical protein